MTGMLISCPCTFYPTEAEKRNATPAQVRREYYNFLWLSLAKCILIFAFKIYILLVPV